MKRARELRSKVAASLADLACLDRYTVKHIFRARLTLILQGAYPPPPPNKQQQEQTSEFTGFDISASPIARGEFKKKSRVKEYCMFSSPMAIREILGDLVSFTCWGVRASLYSLFFLNILLAIS